MQIQPTFLPSKQQESLRRWLRQEEFDTLVEILKSRAAEREIESLNAEVTSAGGTHDGYVAKAAALRQDAQRIRFCIALLEELKKQPDTFQTIIGVPD